MLLEVTREITSRKQTINVSKQCLRDNEVHLGERGMEGGRDRERNRGRERERERERERDGGGGY